ncbi:type II secretion system F family protein [Muricoccus radiodurans]|uniref:type II secretion system F family protein n=1 Tax=Muricoccus radiodurans TaxID=2231721 RepID=UPI003CF64349
MKPAMLPLLAGLAGLLLLLAAFLFVTMRREARLGARLLLVQQDTGVDQVGSYATPRERLLRLLGRLGAALTGSGVLSAKTVQELEQTLQSAGFRSDRALGIFVGAKVAAIAGLPLLAWITLLLTGHAGLSLYILPPAGILGMLGPDFVAGRLRRRYIAEIERTLPDALDLMVICAEAGLALEGTMDRVATEIRTASPAIATEFSLCNSEMRILPDRRAALLGMAQRTGLDSLRRVAVTLSQSVRFGTPLVQALRTLSNEMRGEQMTRFEAKAARLPVLLTLPMIAFILPVLLIVTAGPAVIDVLRSW